MKIHHRIKHHLMRRHKHHQMDNQTPASTTNNRQTLFGRVRIFYVLLFLGVLIVIGGGIFLYQGSIKQNASKKSSATAPKEIIAKVGEENIYQQDLNVGIAAISTPSGAKTSTASALATKATIKKIVLDKLTTDSIILQAAAKDKLITLNSSVYNSSDKDYLARAQLVEQAKKLVTGKATNISGGIVSIWFSNVRPGAVGYEKGKTIALQKITTLYQAVKDNKMTVQQAADTIKNDASLKNVDPSYKSNALLNFSVTKDLPITFFPDFDKLLWNLPKGGITEIYTGKDKNYQTGQIVDSVFMFGQVSNKVSNEQYINFDDWYNKAKKQYEITFY